MEISEAQRGLLERVAAHWIEHGEWPGLTRLRLQLRREGVDLEAILEGLPAELCQRLQQPGGGTALRMPMQGLELTSVGASEVSPCIALVRLASERFIASRDDEPVVTEIDLAAYAPGAPAEALARRMNILKEEWPSGWSSVPGEGHQLRTSMELVRHAGVQTAREFREGKWRRSRGRLSVEHLDASHREIMAWIAERWLTTGEWPRTVDVVVELRHVGDVLLLLEEIPTSELVCWHLNAKDPLRLSLRGLHRASASAVPDRAIELLRHLARLFEESLGEGLVERAGLLACTGWSGAELDRAAELLNGESGLGLYLERDAESWKMRLNERVEKWNGIANLEEYLVRTEPSKDEEDIPVPRVVWDLELHWSGPLQGEEGESKFALLADAELRTRCAPLLRFLALEGAGDQFDTLLREVGVVVETRLRSRSGAATDLTGDALVSHAFSRKGPRLVLSSHANEQQGVELLLRGFMAWIRNPAAHRTVPAVSLHEAMQILVIGDYILGLFDRASDYGGPPRT